MTSSNKKNSSFLVQGTILAVASILVRIIGLIYRIPVTNIVGEEGMAYYGVAFDIYNIALILSSYSLPIAVSKLVAARNINKEYRNSFQIFKSAMTFAIISGATMTLIVFVGADFFENVVFNMPGVALPLRVLAPTIFIFAVMGVLRGYFQGKNTMIPTAISQVLEQIVNAVVSVAAAYLLMKNHSASPAMDSYGAAGGTLGTITGAFVGLLFLLFIYVLYRPTIRRQIRRDKDSKRESTYDIYKLLFITIVPIILSQTVYNISAVIDKSMFGHIMSSQGTSDEARKLMLGVFSSKYQLLTNVPIAISSAIAASMIPSIVASRASGAHEDVKEKIAVSVKFNMIIAFPSAIGLSVLATPILNLLFPNSDPLASKLLQIGSIAIVFFALSTITNAVLQGINCMRLPVIHSSISLAIHIVLVYIMLTVFKLGIFALVIGNVTFALVVCILNWISIQKRLDYHQEISKTFLIPLISSLIMGVAAFFSYKGMHLLLPSNTICTLFAILIAVIVYFIFIILLKGMSEEELYSMPKGRMIVKLLKKFHLLK